MSRWAEACWQRNPAPMARIKIEWQNNVGRWQSYQTHNNERDAFRSAQNRARSTGQRHRLVDEDGRLLDLIDP